MRNRLKTLFARFKTKGVLSIEIPDLAKDTLNLIGSEKCFSTDDVKYELKELGWEIGIMDHETYGLISTMLERNRPPGVEGYVYNH